MRAIGIAAFGVLAWAGFAQPALADENPKPRAAGPSRARAPAPPQAPTSNWTGLQTGANGGNSSLAQNFAEPGAFLCPISISISGGGTCIETPFRFSGHPSSFTAGGFAGYRVQLGVLVIGIEGDLAWKKATTSYVQSGVTPLFVNETFTGSMTQGWDGSVRGRLGVLLIPSLLAYGTGGLAFGNVSGSFSYTAQFDSFYTPASVSGAKSWSDTLLGYTLGGGVELDLGGGLKGRLEYRYTDFGRISKDVPLTSTGCEFFICGTNAHIDMNAAFHTLRFGLGVDL
jgi:outer membrane immunogenic protein